MGRPQRAANPVRLPRTVDSVGPCGEVGVAYLALRNPVALRGETAEPGLGPSKTVVASNFKNALH